jgi:tetratricopeptide (TPR) repeat protein
MEETINSLSKDPLYLILTVFTTASSIILIILYAIEKRIEKKKEEITESEHLINSNIYDKAIEHIETTAKKYPKDPCVYYYLALSHCKTGNIQESLKNFRKAEKLTNSPFNLLNPFILLINKINLYKKYAKALESAEKPNEAITYYKKALNQAKKSKEKEETKVILKEITRIYKERISHEDQ